MDEFVSDVWQHMKAWGIAGKGLYWRPTLLMDIQPGAADRYAEVKALLEDSGLDVHEQVPRRPPRRSRPPKRTSGVDPSQTATTMAERARELCHMRSRKRILPASTRFST